MDKERLITRSLACTLAAVAGFAAVVSYSHIYDLGIRHMYHGATAYLLPLSVDGLIVYSSLVLLYAAKQKVEVPSLGRFTLWLGILATVAANVAYGLPGGLIGATVSAWPAVAFICTVETGMQLAKSKRIRARRVTPPNDTGEVRTSLEPKKLTTNRSVAGEPVEVVPTYAAIRAELGCGQAVAKDLRRIMRESHVDLHKAVIMREEAKHAKP